MRIIILDDETYRHEYFRRLHAGQEVVCCQTVGECRDALREPCDLLSLDYDLASGSSVGILSVISKLVVKPKRVRVHSRSERGAPLLMRGLKNLGLEPEHDRFSYRKGKELLGYSPARRAG